MGPSPTPRRRSTPSLRWHESGRSLPVETTGTRFDGYVWTNAHSTSISANGTFRSGVPALRLWRGRDHAVLTPATTRDHHCRSHRRPSQCVRGKEAPPRRRLICTKWKIRGGSRSAAPAEEPEERLRSWTGAFLQVVLGRAISDTLTGRCSSRERLQARAIFRASTASVAVHALGSPCIVLRRKWLSSRS